MTALGGFWAFGSDAPAAACARIVAAQTLYGRDGSATETTGAVALGRCLSLSLPEDMHDRGPQVGGGGRYTLVADARIDNRHELAATLGLDRAQAARMCDGALILAAVERHGEAAIPRLLGDFALILWDAERERLVLARDGLGARPLHYTRGADFVAVASMPKGLHALPQVPRAPREAALVDFLAGSPVEGAVCFYEAIEPVAAGSIVAVARGGITMTRYWPGPIAPVRFARADDYVDALRAEFDRATACRLRQADGGIATHLSAGLDSSAVAATAARLLGDVPLIAYTAVPHPGTPAPATRLADEGPIAAAVAARYPMIEHRLIRSSDSSPLDGLDRAFRLYDMPARNLCNLVWSDAIALDAQARGVSVMLTGQMGNFTISHDGKPHLAALLRQGRLGALHTAGRGLRREGMRWRGVAMAAAGPYLPPLLWQLAQRAMGRRASVARRAALAPSPLAAAEAVAFDDQPWRDGVAWRLEMLRQTDLGTAYKGLLGGFGLDFRDPTADRRLVEFCLGVPEEQFLFGGVTRSLARRAFADRLPAALLAERRRGYQAADWHRGLAQAGPDVAAEIERLAQTTAARFLDIPRLRALAASWPSDPAGWTAQTQDYRGVLLRALSAGDFARRASGSNR